MTDKKLLLTISMFLLAVFTISFISATVDIRYTAYHGIIEEDSSLTKTTTAVNDYDVKGYTCANTECTEVGSQVSGLTRSTDTNKIIVTFPTESQSQYGYALYFYKNGYIGWQQVKVKVFGNYNGVYDAPTPIYISEKRNAFAPIMNLNVVNQVNENKPIEIGVNVAIDAKTYSALEDVRKANIPLNEPYVDTKVTLEILNQDEEVMYTEEKDIEIPISGSKDVSFAFIGFSEKGDYEIKVHSDVTDDKIINSIRQTASEQIEVIEEEKKDYAYTLISNLALEPIMPKIAEEITFSFNYASYYVNNNAVLNPVDTEARTWIYRNNVLVDTNVFNLNKEGSYSFTESFTESGSYKIIVTGEPEGTYNEEITDTQELTFIVSGQSNNETTLPIITVYSPEENKIYNTTNIMINVTANQDIEEWKYSLNLGTPTKFENGKIITAVEGNNTLYISATNANGTASVVIHFKVDTASIIGTLPKVTIIDPISTTYDTKTIPLNVYANQPIDNWYYKLNDNLVASFTPNTTITAKEGSNTLIVYAVNANGTGYSSVSFDVDLDDNNDDNDDDEDDNNFYGTGSEASLGTLDVITLGNQTAAVNLDSKQEESSNWRTWLYVLLIASIILLVFVIITIAVKY